MLLGGCVLLLLLLAWGVPLPPLRHAVRWERTLLLGGFPVAFLVRLTQCGSARYVSRPLLPSRGLRELLWLGGGLLGLYVLVLVMQGGSVLV